MYKQKVFKKYYLRTPVDRSDDPGDAQTHENIDRVPIELSAYFSCMAAWREANRSGKLVPRATSVMAVTVLQAHQAAKDAGQVVAEGGQYANHQQ